MGSIHVRGTRDNPRIYLSFRLGAKANGSPAYAMRVAKGCRTRADAKRELARIESAIARGEPWEPDEGPKDDVGSLLETWAAGLTNRAAYEDQMITRRDLVPRFRGATLEQVRVREVIAWLGELAKTTMAPQTQRHRFSLLSRFFGWAIENELTDTNPCLMVPKGRRPAAKRVKETPWLDDDTLIPAIMTGLAPDLDLVYYLARFSGLRLGEVCGLRMADMAWIGEGRLQVRYSFNGPLKESKNGSKPYKWVPAPTDAQEVMSIHLKRRRLAGAGDDDLVFPYARPTKGPRGRVRTAAGWSGWSGYHRKIVEDRWRTVANDLGLPVDLTFYGATRHSFTTAALKAGVPLDEVSAAIGHAQPATTKRFYDHWIRKEFAPGLRQGLKPISAAQTGGTESADQHGHKG